MIPATRYFYPSPFLTSWLEEHLSHQLPDGALWDWIAAGEPAQFTTNAPRAAQVYSTGSVVLSADKNTTAADQESSAIDAAWRVYQLTGDRGWLTKPIGGRALVDRLDGALAYVEQHRFDAGLRARGERLHRRLGRREPRPTRTSGRSTSTRRRLSPSGLYANAFFARAAEELAELLDAASEPRAGAEHWRQVGRVGARRDRPPPLECGRAASTGCTGWSRRVAACRGVRRLRRLRPRRQRAGRPPRRPRTRHARRGSSRSPTRGGATSASPRPRGS